MVRNVRLALLATAAVVFANSAALAGSTNSYNSGATPGISYVEPVAVAPMIQPYVEPVTVEAPKDGYYDESLGNNDNLGYDQSFACGGALDGEKCLVILNDHMRRVRLEKEAGTILVGNPTIADVTVLGSDTIFVSARSIGSTNIIVLDKDNNEITTFEVFVREPRTKRVVLRNGVDAENYQCAPQCERALTQSDAAAPYGITVGQVNSDIGLDRTAIGLQSGSNPNTDPNAAAPQGGPQGGTVPMEGMPAANAPAGNAGLIGSVQSLGGSVTPAAGMIESLLGGAGGGNAPAVTTAPPAVAN